MELFPLVYLIAFAFTAGLIDAAVGGGGLIQTPALLNFYPNTPVATLFGTNKLASVFGTASATLNYIRRVKFDYRLIACVAMSAGIFSYFGAHSVSLIPQHILRPIVLLLLILIVIYTFKQKQFGLAQQDFIWSKKTMLLAIVGASAIGFYDGIFGPGTGSFFIFFFIRYLQFDFLHASALAKVANLMTNIAALSFFIPAGHIIFQLGLCMAVANICGSIVGVRMAFKYGTAFIRKLFLLLLLVLIGRLTWQTFS
ncbi:MULTISPECIES: sulfite exporter TauE/SafE family protein [unclassified Acinetobacter]|uniref:sulfite exporter TauE/SafE family protein n=1 Tax=unclassified Acinetobacter TaxID=196816 RepID=UPI0035B7626B